MGLNGVVNKIQTSVQCQSLNEMLKRTSNAINCCKIPFKFSAQKKTQIHRGLIKTFQKKVGF